MAANNINVQNRHLKIYTYHRWHYSITWQIHKIAMQPLAMIHHTHPCFVKLKNQLGDQNQSKMADFSWKLRHFWPYIICANWKQNSCTHSMLLSTKFFLVRILFLCRERCMKSNIVDHYLRHSSVHCSKNDPLYWLLVRHLQNPSQFLQFSSTKISANPSCSPISEAFCTDFEFVDDIKLPCCPKCTTFSLDPWGRGVGARFL